MTMWCSKCRYGSERADFSRVQKCPQCGNRFDEKDGLLFKNPFHIPPSKKNRHEERSDKKFLYDQKGGSDVGDEGGSGALKSIPTESLGLYKKVK